MKPSPEQKEILDKLADDYDVKIDAIAGSGKTCSILFIAKKFPQASILLLTYNARLKLETREKAKKFKLHNLEAHTYHSFGVNYYDQECCRDIGIKKVIEGKLERSKHYEYDIIIPDESQDMTPLLYSFVSLIIETNIKICEKTEMKLCILGDKKQCIYAYQDADQRYLTYADKLFTTRKWADCKLSRSFRITHQMAEFLNVCILREPRMFSEKQGNLPRYLICDTFMPGFSEPYREVTKYLQTYKPEDIFILAPSVRKSGDKENPVRVLANQISTNKVPIYASESNDQKLDMDVIKGKIVVTTFHQAKGLERKVVIVYGFDAGYFEYYKRTANPDLCPNEIYVASTRALECLTMIHHQDNNFFKFLDEEQLDNYVTFVGDRKPRLKKKWKSTQSAEREIGVTDLLRHQKSLTLIECQKYFTRKLFLEGGNLLPIPIKIEQGDLMESVSDINGVAIPSYFEVTQNESCTIDELLSNVDKHHQPAEEMDIPTILELANKFIAWQSGYNYKMNQIKKYDWFEEKMMDKCLQNMSEHVYKEAMFERLVKGKFANVKLCGYYDCYDPHTGTLWEFKCVSQLTDEHFIQLAIYVYLYYVSIEIKEQDYVYATSDGKEYEGTVLRVRDKTYEIKNESGNMYKSLIQGQDFIRKTKKPIIYKLYNILNNEIYEIQITNLREISQMIIYLIESKDDAEKCWPDHQFQANSLRLKKNAQQIIKNELTKKKTKVPYPELNELLMEDMTANFSTMELDEPPEVPTTKFKRR